MWALSCVPGVDEAQLEFLAVTGGAAFIVWLGVGCKRVRIDDKFPYVSNDLTEISMPFGMIADVTESRSISRPSVTIHFRYPS